MIGSENMSLIYERHEPASLKSDLIDWKQIDQKKKILLYRR